MKVVTPFGPNLVPLVAALSLVASAASQGFAQDFPVPYYAVGSNNYRHASTVEEGAARGMADVIRSAGAANLMNSAAANNYEDARKKNIQNRLLRTQTYFEMKKINKEARFEGQQRRSAEDLIRLSKARLPDRLDHTQLDPLTGELKWPMMLRMKSLEKERKRLEELFEQRARNGYVDPEEYLEILELIKKMSAEMRARARDFPTKDTVAARKFLDGLSYETTFQAG